MNALLMEQLAQALLLTALLLSPIALAGALTKLAGSWGEGPGGQLLRLLAVLIAWGLAGPWILSSLLALTQQLWGA